MFTKTISLPAIAALTLATSLGSAATLTVHKTTGPFVSINDALTAANAGDVIEITDNSSTYSENLYITKNNITIQGQVGLNPQPIVEGIQAAHPLPASTAAPQRWFWVTGDANSNTTIFDQRGAVVVNASTGLTLRNLHVKCEPLGAVSGANTSGLLDFRFGTDGVVENCYLNGSGRTALGAEIAGAEKASLIANNHTFRNCTFYRGNVTLEYQGGAGKLRIEDSLVTGPVHALYIYGGNAEIVRSEIVYLRDSAGARANEITNFYGSVNALFQSSMVRKTGNGTGDQLFHLAIQDRGAAFGSDNYNTGRWSPGTIELEVDNCDLIGGSLPNSVTRVVDNSTDRAGWSIKKLRFTDCNIYNIGGPFYSANSSIAYMGNHYQAPGVSSFFENYNVFKIALNTTDFSGFTQGGNSVVLDAGQPLYVDAANGNYQLAANSPAATLNSTGTPAFTGSKGVSARTVPNTVLTVGHTGATYTSIQSALLAARPGDVINIVNNSAPYVQDLSIVTSAGVTLQGDPGLNPRPTIKGTGIPKPFLYTADVHNMTFRNLILDSTDTAGVNATVFENQRPGTVTALHNVKMVGGAGTLYGIVQDAANLQLTNCEVTMVRAGAPGILKRKLGVCALKNSTVTSADRAVEHYAGKLLLKNSKLVSSAGNVIYVPQNATHSNTMLLEFYNSLVRSTATAGSSALIRMDNSTFRRFVWIDNSDLIGSAAGVTPIGLDAQTSLTHARVVDTIHTNFTDTAYNVGVKGTTIIAGLAFDSLSNWENYNAYKNAPNTLNTQGGVRGANNLYLASIGSLYVDPSTGDYRLRPSSAAATLNSTGTPPYAGSQGIGTEGPTAVDADWALYN